MTILKTSYWCGYTYLNVFDFFSATKKVNEVSYASSEIRLKRGTAEWYGTDMSKALKRQNVDQL